MCHAAHRVHGEDTELNSEAARQHPTHTGNSPRPRPHAPRPTRTQGHTPPRGRARARRGEARGQPRRARARPASECVDSFEVLEHMHNRSVTSAAVGGTDGENQCATDEPPIPQRLAAIRAARNGAPVRTARAGAPALSVALSAGGPVRAQDPSCGGAITCRPAAHPPCTPAQQCRKSTCAAARHAVSGWSCAHVVGAARRA
jgi:hypothetical protein